jgi:hypothetical protein
MEYFPQVAPDFPQADTVGSSLPVFLGIFPGESLIGGKKRVYMKIFNGDRIQTLILS